MAMINLLHLVILNGLGSHLIVFVTDCNSTLERGGDVLTKVFCVA